MHGKALSYFLVTLQFASLAAFALTGPWLAGTPWLLVVEFGGLFLGVWALLSVGRGNLHICRTCAPARRLCAEGRTASSATPCTPPCCSSARR